MASVRTATFLGVDITARVVSWGSLEQIKEILLAVAQMFTSENSITVNNAGGAFTSDGAASIIRGMNWYGQLLTIAIDGDTVYAGRVRNITIAPDGGTATITSEDVMKIPAQEPFIGSATNVNPGDALLAIARSVLSDDFIDVSSFQSCGASARSAGATISYAWTADTKTSAMAAMQEIAQLCSISVYVSRTLLSARVFKPYQGQGSGLKQTLTDDMLRAVPSHGYDVLNFVNRVTVGYTGSLTVTVDALDSQRVNRVVRPATYGTGTTVFAFDKASATYFGNLCLSRSSYQRRIIDVTVGPPMNPVDMGDRFPLTSSRFGVDFMPGEVVEAHRDPDRDETTIKLAELYDPNIPPLFPVLNTPRVAFGAPSAYGSLILSNHPTLWQGDREDSGTAAADLSGNGRHGVITGGPLLNQPALVVDPGGYPTTSSFKLANGKYTRITNAAWMDVGTAFTLMQWVKFNGVNSAAGLDRYIIGCAEVSLASGFMLYNFWNQPYLATVYHTASGNHIENYSGAAGGLIDITTNQRMLVAMTYDGLRARCYVGNTAGGMQLNFTGAAHALESVTPATQDFMVGDYPDAIGSGPSDGWHEDGILYPFCMSLAQLTAIWNAGK